MIAPLAPWALLLLLATPGQAARATPQGTHIVFRESPAVALYSHVRAEAGAKRPSSIAVLQDAVDAAQEIDRALGGNPLAWGALDGLLPGAESAADIERAFARAPETLELRGGTKAPLRAGALRLAAALVQGEAAFLESWPAQRELIAAGRARWEKDVGAKESALFTFHLASLGMRDPEIAIPVYLVVDAPWPGAVTHLDDAGKGVCFVAVEPVPSSRFYETILHEATHALDVATAGKSALGELERELQASGLDPRSRVVSDLPHALMFVQSAESIRRVIAPAHTDYGEVEGVYKRFGQSTEALRGFWRDYLDGKSSRAEALDGIVASVAPAPK